MRKVFLLGMLASAGWIAGCEDTFGPGVPADPGIELTVTPSSVVLERGKRVQLVAKIKAGVGPELTRVAIAWYSNNQSVATVQSGGLVRAVAPGEARIEASLGGARATARIMVTDGGGKRTLEALPLVRSAPTP